MTASDIDKIAQAIESRINPRFVSLEAKIADLKHEMQEFRDLVEGRLLPSVVEIENTINIYKDSYLVNKSNIERLDSRLGKIEEDNDILVPSGLVIHR